MDRTNACRGAGIEDITRLQREELGDVGDNLIDTIKHIAGTAFLNRLAIDIQMEMNRLYIQEFFLWHPLADGCRTIKSLADRPGLSSFRLFSVSLGL